MRLLPSYLTKAGDSCCSITVWMYLVSCSDFWSVNCWYGSWNMKVFLYFTCNIQNFNGINHFRNTTSSVVVPILKPKLRLDSQWTKVIPRNNRYIENSTWERVGKKCHIEFKSFNNRWAVVRFGYFFFFRAFKTVRQKNWKILSQVPGKKIIFSSVVVEMFLPT